MAMAACSVTPTMSTRPPSRRSANYQPTSWDYDSIQSLKHGCKNGVNSLHYERLKHGVRELVLKKDKPSEKLKLVNVIQRLGLAYQFSDEINAILSSFSIEKAKFIFKDDLFSMALLFRLLREHQYPISPDLLCTFKDENGDFKACLQKDKGGLLSLYETSHLAFHGENTLDKARIFATKNLKDLMPSKYGYLAKSVTRSLALPLHWRAPRLEARWFIDHYERDEGVHRLVLQLAKLDFNYVQSVHKGELSKLTRWWRDVALDKKLPFARDRLIECFYFATGIGCDPHLGELRQVIAKMAVLTVYLDDIYDVYGTLDELVLFTDAIGRWEHGTMETLPEYMQAMYSTILGTSNEIANAILKEQAYDALPIFKKSWQDVCKAFLLEAKWHHGSIKPCFKDYLNNGCISSTGSLFLLHAFPMLKERVTNETLRQLKNYPKLVQSASTIFRLCNDSATNSAELERGDAPSAIACYMRENGVNEQDSRKAMKDLIIDTWKDINEEAFSRCLLPGSFGSACVNLARMIHCIYESGDSFSAPDEENNNQVKALLFEPIPEEYNKTEFV